MTQAQIIKLQSRIGVIADGFWGPKSIKAAQDYLRAMMPKDSPFPTKKDVEKFYGRHGEPDGRFSPPAEVIKLPFTIYYGMNKPINELSPHVLCADSLLRVFERLAVVYPDTASRKAAGILTYDGLYNARKMRGGSSWSMHSWRIAIDFDAGNNGNKTHWPLRATMPIEVMECFAQEGWTAAGAFWSRDAMHFEAVKP